MKLAIALGIAFFVSVSINAIMFAKLDKAKIELQTAINNQTILERTIQEQNDQIVKALATAKKTQAQIQNLNTQYTQSQAQVTNLRNKFAKHNLEGLAMSKPLLLQSKINKATARVGQDLTNITNPDQFDEKATDNTATTN
tara:strand:+ start:22 stop:444 length:423 start_codon:yes stop_codon:yes gene_type:complete